MVPCAEAGPEDSSGLVSKASERAQDKDLSPQWGVRSSLGSEMEPSGPAAQSYREGW